MTPNLNSKLAQKEIGNIAIDDYKHKIPLRFFCIQCQTEHSTRANSHYFNPLCHKWSYKKEITVNHAQTMHD